MSEQISRIRVKALDAILGERLPVLDDGFIRVIDYMGSDSSVVQAARVSYGSGTKKSREDRSLIRYLMRHRHTTPFEMCVIKVHIRVPMDCWRQWIRHRTASVNEYSTRYSLAIDATQNTAPNGWRTQDSLNKQGSVGFVGTEEGTTLSARESELHAISRRVYNERISLGVAREQARKDLPLSTYTEAYWQIDLHNLLGFLALRMDSHAQFEIRQYATKLGHGVVSKWCPLAWEAFLDFRVEALSLSSLEQRIVSALTSTDIEDAMTIAMEIGWLDAQGVASSKNGERREFEEKLARLGLGAPWKERAD